MKVMVNHFWPRSLLLGLIIGLSLLALLFSQLNLRQAWQTLTRLDGRQLLLPLLVTVGGISLRPWRWQAIFPPDVRPGFFACFSVMWVGNMTNNFLPGRGGDLLRCFMVTRQTSLTRASLVLATLVLEKVLDGLVLLAIVLFSFLFFTPPQWLTHLEVVSCVVFAGALSTLFLLRYRPAYFSALMRSFLKRVRLELLGEKVVPLLIKFGEGLSILSSFKQTVKGFGLTILVWICEAGLIWGLASALQIPLSLPAAALVSVVLGLGLMIPAAPGSIGTYEFFSVASLRLFGIGLEGALALTLIMHAWSFIATTFFGLIGLGMSGMSFSQLFKWASPASSSRSNPPSSPLT